MIGIVFVSHSAKLAEGVLELARGMAGEEVKLAAAGGMDLPGQPLGTDAVRVMQAIEQVYSEEGVVVLMDLGSAILSTEMALDMLPSDWRSHIVLCEAPLVEGAVAAAVQARLGSPLEQVVHEARGALAAKMGHLGGGDSGKARAPEPVSSDALCLRLRVENRMGLHARPAARFVRTAGKYPDVRITVQNLSRSRGPADGRSINALATLGAQKGDEIEIQASGPLAEEALEAFRLLAADQFGDLEPGVLPLEPALPLAEGAPAGALRGVSGSRGLAWGPVRHVRSPRPEIPSHRVEDPTSEWQRLEGAIAVTQEQLAHTLAEVARRSDPDTAQIFDAHLLFLQDACLLASARQGVWEERLNAAAAWDKAVQAVAQAYQALEDEYQRGRAADVLDVGNQVVLNLLGLAQTAPVLEAEGILVASDLTPADTARLDVAKVKAICTAAGGPTSHSAILARSLGIPAVMGLGERLLGLPEGCPLLVDAVNGWVIPEPDEASLRQYAEQAEAMKAEAQTAQAASQGLAVTRDGKRIEIAANLGSLAEVQAAIRMGAEGVGLLRTEFLYLDRKTAPGEDEQVATYSRIAEALEGRPMIIRTLDIGGDKPLPYIDLGSEDNPFLGFRAIRLCLAQPDLFKTQLRAILRVATAFPVKVMFPMVATLEELRGAKDLLAQARAELRGRGVRVPERLETGIMVEIPAAAIRAEQLAPEVDFFSIGTNDLTQYTMAAERGNARLAGLTDAFHPAVLELIRQVSEAAHAQGKWVGVCGELGGDPLAVPILLGLGVDELSMSAPAIPVAKQVVRAWSCDDARQLAQEVLRLDSPARVRERVSAGPESGRGMLDRTTPDA